MAGALLVAGSSASARGAPAAPATVEPLRLTYVAPPGCPTESQFVQEMALRTDRARPAAPGEPARTFTVVIESTGSASVGTLQITGTDGSVSHRDVTGGDCVEVASALTLIAALTVDPSASLMPRAELLATSPPFASPPQPPLPAPPVASNIVAPARLALPAPPERASWSLGASFEGVAGLVPATALGGAVFGDVALGSGALLPSVRVAFSTYAASPTFVRGIGADLRWWVGRLSVCPLRPELSDALRLELCGTLDAGVLHSAGTGLDHPNTTTNPWFAVGAGVRLSWAVTPRFFVELDGGASFPLRRYPFDYQAPGNEVTLAYDLNAVAATFGPGAGYRFP